MKPVTARELLGAEVLLHFNHDGQTTKVSGDSLLDKGDKVPGSTWHTFQHLIWNSENIT